MTACESCLTDNCSIEIAACSTDLCIYEFEHTQGCIIDLLETQKFVTADEKANCADQAAGDALDDNIPGADGWISWEMLDLYNCMVDNEQCAFDCTGSYDGPVGAGGAG